MTKVFSTHGFANILIAVLFMSMFLTLFFFTYGSYMEKQTVKKQSEFLISRITDQIKPMISIAPKGVGDAMNKSIASIKVPDMTSQDLQARKNNIGLLKKSVITILIAFFVTFFLVFSLWFMSSAQSGFFQKFSFGKLMLHNFVIILSVAIVEFTFTTLIISNYLAVDPNEAMLEITNSSQEWSKQCTPSPIPLVNEIYS